MAFFQFSEPVEGELVLSGKAVLVLGMFESGKVGLIRANGELQVLDEPVRVFMSDWPVENEVDSDDKGK